MGVTHAVRRGPLALVAVLAAAFALAAPPAHAAATRAKGIDVSHWNGVIDWIRVAGGGYKFVFGKATEGLTLIDPTYSINRAGTEGFGLHFGAYHFARPAGTSDALVTANAVAQADHFVDVAAPQAGELPPVLDLETSGGLKAARLQQWTRAWMDEIYARTGVHALVYASPNFWKNAVADTSEFASSGTRLWIAHWTKNASPLVPAQNWAGQGWTFWQWTDCSTVPGFAHCSDGDRMNGPNPATVAIAPYPAGAPAVSTAPTIVGGAVAGKALATVPGVWGGGKPVRFTYAWQRCDAAGANCVPITGAIAEKYTPSADDVGHSLVVAVTATTPGGTATVSTPPTAAVGAAGSKPTTRPAALTQPTVAGTAQAGQVLTGSVGTWSGSPSVFSYQWQRCDASAANCLAIAGAGAPTYTLTPDDIGATLSLVVTATGPGGETAAPTAATTVVAPAPLPAVSIGSQAAVAGVAGNVQSDDDRATVTWQPGAVPNGLTMILAPFTGTLTVPGSEIAIGVGGLPAGGFPWPVDVAYTAPQPAGTVLGWSTDAKLYAAVPVLPTPALPAGKQLGMYSQDGVAHVLTRVPVRLALFAKGAWGDPSLNSVKGPSLVQHSKVRVLPRKDRSVLVLTRLSTASQVQLYAQVATKAGARLAILPKGSVLGVPLKPGRAPKTLQTQLLKPGGIPVRLRLNGRFLKPGDYTLRVIAIDPFGRQDKLELPFTVR